MRKFYSAKALRDSGYVFAGVTSDESVMGEIERDYEQSSLGPFKVAWEKKSRYDTWVYWIIRID